MLPSRPISVAALLFAVLSPGVFAQDAGIKWDNLNPEVMELYRTRYYDRKVVVAKKAPKVAEKNAAPDHPDVALLNNLAGLYRIEGQYAQSNYLPASERSWHLNVALKSYYGKFTLERSSYNYTSDLGYFKSSFASKEIASEPRLTMGPQITLF